MAPSILQPLPAQQHKAQPGGHLLTRAQLWALQAAGEAQTLLLPCQAVPWVQEQLMPLLLQECQPSQHKEWEE
jgi:hypothetical protein